GMRAPHLGGWHYKLYVKTRFWQGVEKQNYNSLITISNIPRGQRKQYVEKKHLKVHIQSDYPILIQVKQTRPYNYIHLNIIHIFFMRSGWWSLFLCLIITSSNAYDIIAHSTSNFGEHLLNLFMYSISTWKFLSSIDVSLH
ncbi:hypothetical protein ACJX0J_017886, partial [Zea mays]